MLAQRLLVRSSDAVDLEYEVRAVGFGGGLKAGREIAVEDLLHDI